MSASAQDGELVQRSGKSCMPPASSFERASKPCRALRDEKGGVHLGLQKPTRRARPMGKQRSTQLSTGDGHREGDGLFAGVPSHPECHLLNNCDYLMIIWYQAICRLKRLKLLRLVQVKLLQRRVVVVVVAAMGPARDQALCQSLCPALARRGGYAAARARGGSRCPVRSTNSPSCPAAESAPARSSPLTLCDTVQRAHKHSTHHK